MAKAIKQDYNAEELLEQALVPEDKQPYKVPENWVWTRINTICNFERGITFPASAKIDEMADGLIPCLRTANIQTQLVTDDLIYVDRSYIKNNLNKIVRLDDIIMSSANSRELVGKTSYVDFVDVEMTFGGFVLTIRAKKILSKYLFNMLRLEFLSGNFMGESTQTTNIANINTTILGNYAFPLAPLDEQQRIVDRIESLFVKLDQAKELAQNALVTFENRKSRITGMAIKGDLTQRWRANNNRLNAEEELNVIKIGKKYKYDINETVEFEIPNTWCWVRLGDLIELLADYHANGSYEVLKENVELLDIPDYACMIRTTNFEKNNFNSLMKYISKHAYEFMSKSKLYGDEILINKIGNAGSVYLMPRINRPASLAMNLFMLRLSEKVLPKYIYYHLTTVFSENDISQFVRGVTTKSIDKKSINSIKIALPPLKEQKEIVRILDRLLEKEQKAKELCDVIEKFDLMKKAILSRAFRGELGTNDPGDESAVELLKSCLISDD
jgi:type I restriction enzyme S subunit